MLYVTTREKYDAYTARRTLVSDRGPDGGAYLPFRMPYFTPEEIAELNNMTFGQCVARLLNVFFSAHLSGWDVEFCVGRYPVKMAAMSQKVLVAELWRNLDGSYSKMERNLAARICGCGQSEVRITSWLRIAIRIAALFGLYSELMRMDLTDSAHPIDIAAADGDFTLPMAVWYAREMGLPVNTLICSCREGSTAWELLHQGQCRVQAAAAVTGELERLIYGTMGVDEALRFSQIADKAGIYTLRPGTGDQLRRGIFSTVVSRDRQEAVIPSVYRTNAYILAPDTAMGYAGLMDYRARTGESRCALLLADCSPAEDAEMAASALKMTVSELKTKLDQA